MSSSGSAGSQLFQADTHLDDPDTPHYAEALTASSNRRMVHMVPSTRLASSGESAPVVRRRQLLLTPRSLVGCGQVGQASGRPSEHEGCVR
jgi:hypothetical protein